MATVVKRPTGRQEILDAVLDAAERLFAHAGPAHVSLRAIADAAGVNYGLVHRHFGTKDALFDRVLARYAERWQPRLESGDYLGALDELLGAGPDTGPYLRLLAWTLLSDRDQRATAAHLRYSTLDQLPALRRSGPPAEAAQQAGTDTTDTTGSTADDAATAAALALAFGWRFFNPYIRDALRLDDKATDMQTAIRRYLHRIATT
jgi:TetR/AcrR family transcriptional regulator, repressor for neighboring sulfatase